MLFYSFSFFLLLPLPTPELFISLTYSVSSVRHIFPDLLTPPHKVLTYIEYRAVSGVFGTIDPHPPLHPASVSSLHTKGGGYTLAGRWGGGGVNISEDARHWIGLLQSNPFTFRPLVTTCHISSVGGAWGWAWSCTGRPPCRPQRGFP